jgi:protocatechuate 3,4-dioxygenase beta subunit
MSSRAPRSIVLTLLFLAAVVTCPPPTDVKADNASQTPARGRMFVVGRVLDHRGNRVPGATVMVYAHELTPRRAPFVSTYKLIPLGDARADDSGRFRIDAPRTSSTRYEDFGAVAIAPGFGAGWVALDPDDDRPAAEISLRPEQVIHGRLFDLQGRPVPDVSLSVSSIRSIVVQARAELRDRSVRRRSDGVSDLIRGAHDLPAWPRPMTTDSEGRFTVRGIGQNLHALLVVRHPQFAHQTIEVDTDDSASKSVTAALVPPQILNVRVTYADTGQPAAHAPLRVMASQGRIAKVDESETDAEGKARLNSFPADRSYRVEAWPLEGQPYLHASGSLEWPKGALEQTLNIALPRGAAVHGKVTEEGSGKPIPGALVEFEANGENRRARAYTQSDGSFQLGAEPKPGHIFVRGPDDDYVLQAIDSGIVLRVQSGGSRMYSHAFAALDLKPGMGSQEANMVLRRGATVEGRVVGPDGQPVRNAWVFSRLNLDPTRGAARRWIGSYHGKLREGRFEIRGLASDADIPVFFLEPERKLGAVVNFSARSASDRSATVRLEPCGSAWARLVDPDGKPVTKSVRDLAVKLVVTSGPAMNPFPNPSDKNSLLSADEYDLTSIDPINYERPLAPDADGRIALPVLIPGATYRFIDYTMYVRGQTGPEIRKEFKVKPGQKLLLGDIRIAKPPR